jgi:hypothetical protein
MYVCKYHTHHLIPQRGSETDGDGKPGWQGKQREIGNQNCVFLVIKFDKDNNQRNILISKIRKQTLKIFINKPKSSIRHR